MLRHVIKGRGENRGKYLCWARQAPGATPTEDGFVWLPEQRKAVRWKDPRYSGDTWATDRARLHNGYFVKLVASAAVTEELVSELRSFIAGHTAGAAEKLDAHWVHGAGKIADSGCDGEATDFCHDCCTAKVDEIFTAHPKEAERAGICVDGGWGTDHDSPPRCDTCGAKLSGNLTEYGADQEIEALTGDCAPAFDDAEGWEDLDDAIVNLSDDDPRWRKIAKVVEAARAAEREKEEQEAALAAEPGMPEARTALLGLLAVRMEQKAPEPSYRLWPEFQAWMLIRFDKTPEVEATEKRLFKEAIVFLRLCGIKAYMTNGGMGMAEAPHGTYYWPFIVETEQRKLWKDVDMATGRAVGLACLGNDDAPGRDANPFKLDDPDASRSRAWDDGFLLGLHEAARAAEKP